MHAYTPWFVKFSASNSKTAHILLFVKVNEFDLICLWDLQRQSSYSSSKRSEIDMSRHVCRRSDHHDEQEPQIHRCCNEINQSWPWSFQVAFSKPCCKSFCTMYPCLFYFIIFVMYYIYIFLWTQLFDIDYKEHKTCPKCIEITFGSGLSSSSLNTIGIVLPLAQVRMSKYKK